MIIDSTDVSIALIGATGAIGREIVEEARKNTNVKEIFLICRQPLDEWSEEKDSGSKLTII